VRDLSSLNDGVLTATATQTDGAGNLGPDTDQHRRRRQRSRHGVPTVNAANATAVTLSGVETGRRSPWQ
jgi:hypothetical protein